MKSLVDGADSVAEERSTWADFSSSASIFTQPIVADLHSSVTSSVLDIARNDGNDVVNSAEYDDWQNFSETGATSSLKLSILSKEVMRSCFETQNELDCETQFNSCILYDKRYYI